MLLIEAKFDKTPEEYFFTVPACPCVFFISESVNHFYRSFHFQYCVWVSLPIFLYIEAIFEKMLKKNANIDQSPEICNIHSRK